MMIREFGSGPGVFSRGVRCEEVRSRRTITLRSLGIGLSIDDFGSGYSSLAYLQRLPVDEIEIDRSLIRPIREDADSRAIVRAAEELARNLRLRSVAEGLEDKETMSLLGSLGCDARQDTSSRDRWQPPS